MWRAAGESARREPHTEARRPSQEIRLSWAVHERPAPETRARIPRAQRIDRLEVAGRRRHDRSAPRQRRPELAKGQVVVVAVDARGEERERSVVPDPRILRVELPDADGELQGIELIRPDAELLVTLPDEPGIRELRVYEPRWNGQHFELELVDAVELD